MREARRVSLKAFTYGTIEPALGGTVRQVAKIQSGIASDKAKEMTKAVKDSKLKVQAQIQGEQVRVLSKSKDELQVGHGVSQREGFWHRFAVYQLPYGYGHNSKWIDISSQLASVLAALLDDCEHRLSPLLHSSCPSDLVFLTGCNRSDPIVVIQLHPKNPDIIYVATNDYIYKTRDGGQTWTNLSQGHEPFARDLDGG